MKPRWWDDAARELARRDPVLRRLVKRHPGVSLKRRNDAFTALARAITGQQISVKAADAIWSRCVGAHGVATRLRAFPRLDPSRLAVLAPADLRALGYSERKAAYVIDLASHFANGRLDPRAWKGMDDDAVVEALVAVRGVGRWTAEMFLMFHELRPDVLPVDDLGLRKAAGMLFGDGATSMAAKDVVALGERWRPWRSAATWYLWRSMDPVDVAY